MSKENKGKLRLPIYQREGVDTFSEVSAFLGGIFFTSLLILVQQREKFDVTLLEINLLETLKVRISELHLIAVPLSISVILFIFSSVFFAIACSKTEQDEVDKFAEDASNPFVLGLISMFISLFVVLAIVDIVVGVLGIILAVGTLIWWTRKRTK